MAAAWALSHLPDWQNKFDITVYQMGWRLGGKGASGRDAANAYRILEHGLHVWGGFYENAFRVMQQVYGELPPDAGNALPSWTDAFKKLSNVILQEDLGVRTVNWEIDFPENSDVPGTGGKIPSPWDYVEELVEVVWKWIHRYSPSSTTTLTESVKQEVEKVANDVASIPILRRLFPEHPTGTPSLEGLPSADVVGAAKAMVEKLPDDVDQHKVSDHDLIAHFIEQAVRNFAKEIAANAAGDDTLRRVIFALDYAQATIRGILADGVLHAGWEAINGYEWTSWLSRRIIFQSSLSSPLIRGIYDYVFGYMHGNSGMLALEAGTATHGILRLFFTYKGAIFWEMQAGMGDIIFAAMYRALALRGVKFRFFHKIEAIHVASGVIESIDVREQAKTIGGGDYDPLIRVNGVWAWPSEPDYGQLVDGNLLRGINLESSWAPQVGTVNVLKRGTDFDSVILGISLAALNDVAQEVSAASVPFRQMMANVGTVQTASMQLWLDADAARLGASIVHRAATACKQPLNTWSDMSFLLQREQWPPNQSPPKYLAYFCGQFDDAPVIPPYSDHGFPARELARYRGQAVDWLQRWTGTIWSRATTGGAALDWSLLHDAKNRTGVDRLDAQFLRVNIDPTERYVASFPATSRYRLYPDESGISNLFLTGDWVRTPFNAGCVEAAVIAGLHCAAAVSGEKVDIIGGAQ
jgi:uncharacterized protein with NAD-binding domain and iron-sulfur cluster